MPYSVKKRKLAKIVVTFILLLAISVTLLLGILHSMQYGVRPEINAHADNVILLIGDGMGFNHIAIASYFGEVALEQFEYGGSVATHSLSHKITDSAAAATAMATGEKTINGMLSYSAFGRIQNLGQLTKHNDKRLGIVVTKPVTDATPAAFTAHNISRSRQKAIAYEQIISADCDVLFGAGKEYFDEYSGLIETQDRAYLNTYEALQANTKPKAYAIFDEVTPESEHNLAILTSIALAMLQNENGFFLMVEGSKIDSHSHSNDMDAMLAEFWIFNAAILIALDFAANNPNTTVIVVADHETGGLTLPEVLSSSTINDNCFTTDGHTAADVPYFAYGSGAEQIPSFIDNTDIFYIITQLLFS